MYDQRLTFHPSHFVKLASLDDDYVAVSLGELELHSQVGQIAAIADGFTAIPTAYI